LIPKTSQDKRYLRFSLDGISLVDQNDEVHLRNEYVDQNVTWTIKQLQSFTIISNLQQLWEFHVPNGKWSYTDGVGNAGDGEGLALLYGPKGAPIVGQHQRNFEHYGKPPHRGDATWIINEFLNECIGNEGGRLFSGNMEKFPTLQTSHHKTLLKNFIGRPEYLNYPYRMEWQDILGHDNQSSTNTVRANISFCRDIVGETAERRSGGVGPDGKAKMNMGKWWHIGPRKEGW
jgi:hypothetical protein